MNIGLFLLAIRQRGVKCPTGVITVFYRRLPCMQCRCFSLIFFIRVVMAPSGTRQKFCFCSTSWGVSKGGFFFFSLAFVCQASCRSPCGSRKRILLPKRIGLSCLLSWKEEPKEEEKKEAISSRSEDLSLRPPNNPRSPSMASPSSPLNAHFLVMQDQQGDTTSGVSER